MTDSAEPTDDTAPPEPRTWAAVVAAVRPAVALAAVGSVVAGLVNAVAAGGRPEDPLFVWVLGACAVAQFGWGVSAALSVHPVRTLLLAGGLINGVAVLVWALTRTDGPQHLAAAALAALSMVSVMRIVARPTVDIVLIPAWTGMVAIVACIALLPAAAAGLLRSDGGDTRPVSTSELAAATDDHPAPDAVGQTDEASVTSADGHGHAADTAGGITSGRLAVAPFATTSTTIHGHTDTTSTTSGPDNPSTTTTTGHDGHPPAPIEPPIISVDDPRLTPQQADAAVALIVGTIVDMRPFITEADVVAAGYESIGDGGAPGQYTHFVNWSYLTDGFELDPAHVESIVMKMNADGSTRVVAGMYALTLGKGADDVPEIAGSLTTWHDHDNMCFDGTGFVGLAVAGGCTSGLLLDMPPMLHVWVEETGCGPFGIIDSLGNDCGAVHGH